MVLTKQYSIAGGLHQRGQLGMSRSARLIEALRCDHNDPSEAELPDLCTGELGSLP